MGKKHSIYASDIRRLSSQCQYLILNSTRGCAKSYACKQFVIEENIKNNAEFIYLRRSHTECKDIDVQDYFSDMDIENLTKGKYNNILVYRKRIYLIKEEDNKVIDKKRLGIVMDLFHYDKKKSIAYPLVKYIIFEEYCTDSYYLKNEPDKLQHLVSTIARDNDISVMLLGNKLSRFNPYMQEWGLLNAQNQATGTIDTYTYDIDDKQSCIIKVYNIKKIEEKSKMFFGNIAKSINGNDYTTSEMPRLTDSIEEYKKHYDFVVECHKIRFLCQLLQHKRKKNMLLFVMPKTSDVQKKTRLITDNLENNDILTTHTFTPLSETERRVFDLIKNKHIAYATNLCGTEFEQAITILGK